MNPSYLIFAVGLLLKLFSAYFVIIALFALKKPAGYPQAIPKTKFAVVIAARNEAKVIGELVKSLKMQDYPAELFDVYVVPNNCSDNTAEQAVTAGAEIIHCTGPVHYKGDALSQSLKQLMQFDYDAFVIFDADNVVDKKYLLEMNHAFCSGAKVAKGKLLAKTPMIRGSQAVMISILASIIFSSAGPGQPVVYRPNWLVPVLLFIAGYWKKWVDGIRSPWPKMQNFLHSAHLPVNVYFGFQPLFHMMKNPIHSLNL